MQTEVYLAGKPPESHLETNSSHIDQPGNIGINQNSIQKANTLMIMDQTFDRSYAKEQANPVLASRIKWSDYDWPICCKIIHFSLNEIHPKIRATFTALYVNFFLLIIELSIKIICHCFLLPKNNLNIIFVLCLSPILALLKIASFYSAYRGLFYDDSFKMAYKVTSIIFVAFALVNVGVGDFIFDGVPRLLRYTDGESMNVFVLFMLIFEFSVNGIFVIIEIAAFTMFLVYEKKYDQ
jgi:hypothetical protein